MDGDVSAGRDSHSSQRWLLCLAQTGRVGVGKRPRKRGVARVIRPWASGLQDISSNHFVGKNTTGTVYPPSLDWLGVTRLVNGVRPVFMTNLLLPQLRHRSHSHGPPKNSKSRPNNFHRQCSSASGSVLI
jgi:hypothetical protein